MLLKHILLEITDLEILNNKKLNKELEKNDLFNIVNIQFQKKILTKEEKLTKTCCFGSNKIKKTISRN